MPLSKLTALWLELPAPEEDLTIIDNLHIADNTYRQQKNLPLRYYFLRVRKRAVLFDRHSNIKFRISNLSRRSSTVK